MIRLKMPKEDSSDVKIPIFNGKASDFKLWEFKFRNCLIEKDYDDMVGYFKEKLDGLNEPRSYSASEIKKNKRLFAMLVRALDDQSIRMIQYTSNIDDDGLKAWILIHKHFARDDTLTLVKLEKEYQALELKPYQDPQVYIIKIKELAMQLRELGSILPDKRIAAKIVSGLSPEYENFLAANLDITSDIDILKEKIYSYYIHIISKRNSNVNSGENVNYSNDRSRGRGRGRGHYNKNNRFSNNNNNNNNSNNHRGNTRGRGNKNGNNTRQNSNKPAFKKGIYCNNCNKEGHMYRDCFAKGGGKEGQYPQKDESNQIDDSVGSFYVDENNNDEVFLTMNKNSIIKLYIDSACTRHMIKDRCLFTNIESDNRSINTAFGTGSADGIGSVRLKFNGEHSIINITAKDVLYISTIPKNLLCTAALIDKGNDVDLKNLKLILKNNMIIPIKREGNLYYIEALVHTEEANIVADDINLWHMRLGHVNTDMLKKLPNHVEGMYTKNTNDKTCCDICKVTKSKKKRFAKFKEKEPNPLDTVVTDLSGRVSIKSLRGNEYVSGFVDSNSRFTMVFPIKTKDEAINTIDKARQYVSDVGTIKKLLSDLGGEYMGNELKEYCIKHGIKHEFVPKETPEQVGQIERRWGVLFAITRSSLKWAELPYEFWDWAIENGAYIMNRTLTNGNMELKTPYELFKKKMPNLCHMRVFGCKCFVHLFPSQRDNKKLGDRAKVGIFLGYGSEIKGYRVYLPDERKIVYSRHVTFDEYCPGGSLLKEEDKQRLIQQRVSKRPLELHRENDDGNNHIIYTSNNESKTDSANPPIPQVEETIENESQVVQHILATPNNQENGHPNTNEDQTTINENLTVTRSGRVSKPMGQWWNTSPSDEVSSTEDIKDILHNIEDEYTYKSSDIKSKDPWTYKEAINRQDGQKWKEAMNEEIKQLEKRNTWKWVPLPSNRKAISSKWVYKIKENADGSIERYKARLVARGFTQEYGIDYNETFAPVVRSTTKRIMMAIAATEGWKIKQLDIKSAFVNATVEEDIYMKPPEGMEVKKDKQGNKLCLKLERALYGLKQAGRNWYENLEKWLLSQNFVRSKVDPCLFVKLKNKTRGYMAISCYVDDLDILVENQSDYQIFMKALKSKYEISDLGNLDWSLGINVYQTDGHVKINQEKYINDMLRKYKMEDCKTHLVPAIEKKLTKDDCPPENSEYQVEMRKKPYRNLVGSLLYSAIWTRPDISYAVSACSRYLENPGSNHWNAAKRILRYMKGTKSLGIQFNNKEGLELYGYCDADWAGELDSRRSTTGYVFILAGGSVSWKVKAQPTVALSSAEAEYMALSAAVQEAIYLRNLMNDLGYEVRGPTTIYQDNQACMAMAKNPTNHQRRKHIDIRYHFINEAIETNKVEVRYCKTEEMHADIFTKPLSRIKFEKHRCAIMN
tara:strand:- start:24 stop:4298 length:4275 start_codon:yes stop_codon:yes gene_type:complete